MIFFLFDFLKCGKNPVCFIRLSKFKIRTMFVEVSFDQNQCLFVLRLVQRSKRYIKISEHCMKTRTSHVLVKRIVKGFYNFKTQPSRQYPIADALLGEILINDPEVDMC